MKIAIYARISTNASRQESLNQLKPLREWAERLDGELVQEYIDEASGTNGDRKAFKKLLDDAHKRKFSTLLFWSLDRVSREGIRKTMTYLEKLKGYGVRVLSHQESWLDTEGPTWELMVAITSWIAKQESQRLSERIRAGLRTAKSKGRVSGRPKRNIDIEKAMELRAKGYSIRKMAQHLRVPRSTLSEALSGKHSHQTGTLSLQ